MKSRKWSLTTQIITGVSLFLLFADVFLGVSLTMQSQKAIKSLINSRMLDMSNTAASMLDGDVVGTFTAEDEGSEDYEAEMDKLRAFQNNMELKYIYCIKKVGESEFVFSIDPAEDPGEFGSPIVYTEALNNASNGIPSVDMDPYEDSWGKFYSAYSPVFDSAGNVAVIVAVDFSATWYDEQTKSFVRIILADIMITVVVGVFLIIFVMRNVRSYFDVLVNDLNDLAEDVDDITRELADSSGADIAEYEKKTGNLEGVARNEIQLIGLKIHSVRDHLRLYMDHAQRQANNMITALASDYWSVYYVNLDKDKGTCFRSHTELENGLKEGETFCFSTTFRNYAHEHVAENYREEFLKFIDPVNIRQRLLNETLIAYSYLSIKDGRESYEMIRIAGVRRVEDREDHIVHSIGVGFTDVDAEMRRTLEQSQALSDALSVAEEASKAKTAFLSSMSHEIRTPMNAIIGIDKIALSDPDISDQTRDYLEQIGSSADHLLKIINDILDMSRIESGKMVIKNEEFSLRKLLDQVDTIIGSQCKDKDINYTSQIIGDVDRFFIGDGMKLEQIIINILGNAVKFTPAGGDVSFTVERTKNYGGKSLLKFTVIDNGIGMDEEYLPRIFDAFSQEDASNTNKYGSTGLGMAITKNIVDMLNGEISVTSKKGEGTRFVVTVTLMDSDHVDEDEVQEKSEASGNEEVEKSLAGKRILLAEDIEVNARIMMKILDIKKLEVEHAENGKIAVQMFEDHPEGYYDAILMDMRMPEMDGLTATTVIRALDRQDAKKIPIIALTANAFDEDVQRSLQAGMNAHLSKPVEPEVIFSTLEEFISSAT
ncbi:hybrid sensor histidine kinase/response regulator [Butyrivibrio sp. VCD2006]|uniref:hybrid sensor histidine kinase/response regulator n=1 Tax=Butyrivibrio sp. VCD2006 TaxID=1280664 RepID=UPI00040BE4E9|nr:ATP-binding protein [Butyrivibrio sp. VCD2006]